MQCFDELPVQQDSSIAENDIPRLSNTTFLFLPRRRGEVLEPPAVAAMIDDTWGRQHIIFYSMRVVTYHLGKLNSLWSRRIFSLRDFFSSWKVRSVRLLIYGFWRSGWYFDDGDIRNNLIWDGLFAFWFRMSFRFGKVAEDLAELDV